MIDSSAVHSTDTLVVGSGAGGLIAAILAHDNGSKTIVIEKSAMLGGSTSISAGGIWIPCNNLAIEAGIKDSKEDALRYLRRITMGQGDEKLLGAYLDEGPKMVDYIQQHTAIHFGPYSFPDYHPEIDGSNSGRALVISELYDGKLLPPDIVKRIRRSPFFPPINSKERAEWKATNKLDLDMVAKRIEDKIFTMGSALTAALVKECLDRGIDIIPEAPVRGLIYRDNVVQGVKIEQNGENVEMISKVVILACGGFDWNDQMKKDFLKIPVVSPMGVTSNEGDGIIMGMEVGAALGNMNEAWWTPVIKVPGEEIDGKPVSRSINDERARPHSIIVNRSGRRFVNEAHNYNAVGKALHYFDPVQYEYQNIPAFLIFDNNYRAKYNFLNVMPREPIPRWVKSGDSLTELAGRLGIDSMELKKTISEFNTYAKSGIDLDFHRGESEYDKRYGDLSNELNPCLGTIDNPPFYGVEVYPGTLGTKGGLKTNSDAQVLNVKGDIIKGLYATGNVTASPMGIGYPGPGVTIGQAMVFGYIAGKNAALE